MAEIITFPGAHPFVVDDDDPEIASIDLPSERVLQAAINADLRDLIVIGRENETDEFYLATTGNNLAKIILFLELAKKRFLSIGDSSGED